MYLIWNNHNHREGHKNPVSSSFRSRITAYCVSAVDSGRGWAAMLDLSSNVASNRKTDRSGVSGRSILGGNDTTFGYLAVLDPKLFMKTWSAAAILDFTLHWPYATDFQKAPPGLLKGVVCRTQNQKKNCVYLEICTGLYGRVWTIVTV